MTKFLGCILAIACFALPLGCTDSNQGTIRAGDLPESETSQISQSSDTTATSASSEYVELAAAKAAALNHAGLTEADVTFIQAELDLDNSKMVYDIEFVSGGAEYDYEVDAYTAEILSYDYDIELYPSSTGSAQTTTSDSSYIGEDAAKQAALEHAGLAETDVTILKVRLDYDDGRAVYDVEFYAGSAEYDYEIDAYTGDLISYDYDVESFSSGQTSSDTWITLDEAKNAALSKAGLSEDQVTYTETSLDYDDGRAVYQIEFISNDTEYEIEIDAASGSVLSYETETYRRG